jgi:hypothetical protein
MQENRALKSVHKAGEALKLLLLRRTRSSEFFDFELSHGNPAKHVVPEVAVAIYANDELQGYRSSNGNPRARIGGRKSRGALRARSILRCEKQSFWKLSESSGELTK